MVLKRPYHSGGPGGREKVGLGKAEPNTELNTTSVTFACEKRRHFAFPLIFQNSCFLGKWQAVYLIMLFLLATS